MLRRMEWRVRPGRIRLLGAILLLGLGACASSAPPPPVETARKPAPPPRRLAWLPLDAFDGPVALAVNDQMSRVKPTGTSASTKAAVSMEVAQLAIECIQPTPACYGAVARSLNADRLMWAELQPSAADEKIQITVLMFDVEAGKSSRRMGTFADEQAARTGVADLVQRAAVPAEAGNAGSQPQ
jgi:hypothetical protein